jgi:acyl carrier protein
MHLTTLKLEIRSFIAENFLYGVEDAGLKDSASFLANGLIDSTGVLELVSFVEDKYGVVVKDDELVPANFDSVDNLANFILKKAGTPAGGDALLSAAEGQITPCINLPS